MRLDRSLAREERQEKLDFPRGERKQTEAFVPHLREEGKKDFRAGEEKGSICLTGVAVIP